MEALTDIFHARPLVGGEDGAAGDGLEGGELSLDLEKEGMKVFHFVAFCWGVVKALMPTVAGHGGADEGDAQAVCEAFNGACPGRLKHEGVQFLWPLGRREEVG